jgi:S-adenosylmethionine-dependent methyltransferase
VEKYAAFLETFEGRLRFDLTLANVQEFLPQASSAVSVLDVGCGTGAMGISLAKLGYDVTLLDSSQPMLEFAKAAAQKAGVDEKLTLKHGDAGDLARSFPDQSFDVILCHNVLEYVDDPEQTLRSVTGALRDSSSVVSILVRNQAGDALKAAIKEGDLNAAEHALTAEWGYESLYGGKVRLFTPNSLQGVLKSASLETLAECGVRVVSDYLPAKISRETEYQRIFDLERTLGARQDFAAIARYTHCIARRADVVGKDGR